MHRSASPTSLAAWTGRNNTIVKQENKEDEHQSNGLNQLWVCLWLLSARCNLRKTYLIHDSRRATSIATSPRHRRSVTLIRNLTYTLTKQISPGRHWLARVRLHHQHNGQLGIGRTRKSLPDDPPPATCDPMFRPGLTLTSKGAWLTVLQTVNS